MHPLRAWLICLTVAALAGCATRMGLPSDSGMPTLKFQNKALNPTNGGTLASAVDLKPGDIILTADNGINSASVRLATFSPVSHAAIYVGDEMVVESVGSGTRYRTLADLLAQEVTAVAFRHPGMQTEQAQRLVAFARSQIGQKYNYTGILLQAPFVIERRLCELPLIPSPVRDFCIQGIAAVQLGLGRNDRFFCSQLVLEAFRSARLPLTDADPRLVTPGDLLHMREGDVPSIQIHQALQYVGHLKAPPLAVAVAAPNDR